MEEKKRTGMDLIVHQRFLDGIISLCSNELDELYTHIKRDKYWFDKKAFMGWLVDCLTDDIPMPIRYALVLGSLGYVKAGETKEIQWVYFRLKNYYKSFVEHKVNRQPMKESEIFYD